MARIIPVDLFDIKEAALDSRNLLAPRLRGYAAARTSFGTAFCAPGNLAGSIKMVKAGAPDLCLRCWYKVPDDPEMLTRLGRIARGIAERSRRMANNYFITYEIADTALRTEDGDEIPGLIMDWLNADTLSERVCRDSKADPATFDALAKQFARMCADLNSARISHGDLSGGNIMLTPSGMKLIDYDSVYVPEMGRTRQVIIGDESYQHPGRAAHPHCEITADYFSQHIIYVSLMLMARDRSLRPEAGDKRLVFESTDLRSDSAFTASAGYRKGMAMGNSEIKRELETIAKSLCCDYLSVPPLNLEPPKPRTTNYVVRYCTMCGHNFGDSTQMKYCPMCGTARHSFTKTT